MKAITLEELLEAGCHFGHQVTRANPKAREFVFEQRDNIQIIDLGKTKEGLEESARFLLSLAQNPDATLLVVGTKRQAVPLIEEALQNLKDKKLPEGRSAGIFTVTKRWMGGTLTNTLAISRNYERLKELTEKINSDEWKQKYTKRELSLFEKERQKYEIYYGGIVNMKKMPSALFVIDTHTEDLSVREATRMGIPVVGIVDTNADPDLVEYVIPANDDAVGSLKLLINYILDAWMEGKMAKGEEQSAKSEPEEKKEIKPVISNESEKSPKKEEGKIEVPTAQKSPKSQKETKEIKVKKVEKKGLKKK